MIIPDSYWTISIGWFSTKKYSTHTTQAREARELSSFDWYESYFFFCCYFYSSTIDCLL